MFKGICNNRFFREAAIVRELTLMIFLMQVDFTLCFKKTNIVDVFFLIFQILFLNKLDLFKDKIRYSGRHLRLFFEEFRGNAYLNSRDVLIVI